VGLFDFLKKNRSFAVRYHLENWVPLVTVPASYDKLFSLRMLLEREGIKDYERILESPYPFVKAKQVLGMPSPDERVLPFIEGDRRMRRLIMLGTIERGSALELMDLFAMFMVYRFATSSTWELNTHKPSAADFYESFFSKMAGTDDRAVQLVFSDNLIACLADMILRSKLTLVDASDRMCGIISRAASESHSAGSHFIREHGVDKTEALVKRSLQAFFQDGRKYSLSTILIKDQTCKPSATSSSKPEQRKDSGFSFDLNGDRLGSSEKGVFYSIKGEDKTKVLSFLDGINSILSKANGVAKGFPKTTVSESTFKWVKSSHLNPSLIIASTVTATGRKPKYPYVVELFMTDDKGQVILSILPDGNIGRMETHLSHDPYFYDMVAGISKGEIKFSKISRTSMKNWQETRWV